MLPGLPNVKTGSRPKARIRSLRNTSMKVSSLSMVAWSGIRGFPKLLYEHLLS